MTLISLRNQRRLVTLKPPRSHWAWSKGSPHGPALCHPLPPLQSPPALLAKVNEQLLPLRAQQDPLHLSLEAGTQPDTLLRSFPAGMHGRTESCAKSVRSGEGLDAWLLRKHWHAPPSASVLQPSATCLLTGDSPCLLGRGGLEAQGGTAVLSLGSAGHTAHCPTFQGGGKVCGNKRRKKLQATFFREPQLSVSGPTQICSFRPSSPAPPKPTLSKTRNWGNGNQNPSTGCEAGETPCAADTTFML